MEQTVEAVTSIEARLGEFSEVYSVTIGAGGTDTEFAGIPAGLGNASFVVQLSQDAPQDIAETLREELDKPGQTLRISEVSAGPPVGGIDISVTGANYDDIAAVSAELTASIATIDGAVNLESDVTEARTEVVVEVDPEKAALVGLTTQQVGLQLSQYLIGQRVTTINIDGDTVDVVLSGDPRAAGGIEQLKSLIIVGPAGAVPLGDVAEPVLREGPVSITRTDGVRSSSIAGDIVSDNTQAVGILIDEKIAALDLPPGVTVTSGGIFADIEEGFQAIFISMAVGIVLVYLVMVASLGSLRNPLCHRSYIAPGAHWRYGLACDNRPSPWSGGHDGGSVTHRYRGHQRHRADILRGTTTDPRVGRLRSVDFRRTSAAAPHSDDGHHHQLCTAAPRRGVGGRRDYQCGNWRRWLSGDSPVPRR